MNGVVSSLPNFSSSGGERPPARRASPGVGKRLARRFYARRRAERNAASSKKKNVAARICEMLFLGVQSKGNFASCFGAR